MCISTELMFFLPHADFHSVSIPLKDFLDAPPYTKGFYQSEACKPNESEMNVIKHYKDKSDWSKTEKEAAIQLARDEGLTFVNVPVVGGTFKLNSQFKM